MTCIYAGIISYNPDINRLRENIGSVLPQVQGLIVVDNGSDNIADVRKLLLEFDSKSKLGVQVKNSRGEEIADKKLFLIENNKNFGVAYALNQIMSEATAKGRAEWVLTLDQDTVVYDNIISLYEPYLDWSEENKSIHIASLTCLRRDRNYIEKNENGIKNSKETNDSKAVTANSSDENKKAAYEFVHTCITSGNLVSVAAWKSVKGFDERLFIDMVDDEFCLRLEENDYDILRINSYGYLHEMGSNLIKVKVFGREKTIFAYSPERKYYTARNITYICKRYKDALDRKNAYTSYLKKRILGTILYEKHKLTGLKAYIKGIRDGKKMC